jgi:hypothetical protein
MALGPAIVRPLAAVARPEVRVSKGRGRNGERSDRERQSNNPAPGTPYVLLIRPFPVGHGAEKCGRAIGDAKTGRTLSARTLKPRQSPPADAPRDAPRRAIGPHGPLRSVSDPRTTARPVSRVDECPRALLAPPPRGLRSARTGPHRNRAACRRHTTEPRHAWVHARPGWTLQLCSAAACQGRGAPEEGQGKPESPPNSGGPQWARDGPHGPAECGHLRRERANHRS